MSEACDYLIKIGVDEAGRGPLLGRVYAAACVLPLDNTSTRSFDVSILKDSKSFLHLKKYTTYMNMSNKILVIMQSLTQMNQLLIK